MMRGMGNMAGMMKQVQKAQKEMVAAQELINEKEFTGTAGNDLVTVVFTGDKEMTSLSIKPEIVDPEDTEMMSDLIITAVNEALEKIENETQETIGKYTKGIPGL